MKNSRFISSAAYNHIPRPSSANGLDWGCYYKSLAIKQPQSLIRSVMLRYAVLLCARQCGRPPHRLLNGAVVLADVMDDAGDAERAGEAQQVGQEAERDAEDERSAKCFPQRLPDQLRALGCCVLRPLREDQKKGDRGGN